MSFEGSRATIIKNLSGFTARVDSSGYLYTLIDSTISATAAISGQTVATWGGSGRNAVYITNQSGNVPVQLSNSSDTLTDNSANPGMVVQAILHARDRTANIVRRLTVTDSGSAGSASGVQFKLLTASVVTNQDATRMADVTVSGGQLVATQIGSGYNAVYLTNQSGDIAISARVHADLESATTVGMATYSLNAGFDGVASRWNRVRTTISGSAASQGGIQFRMATDTTQAGSNIRTAGIVAISDASGGAALSTSASCIHGIVVRPISGAVNAMIHIGSSGNPPWISGGLGMDIGESREFKAHNPAFIRVFARVSGTMVSWAGVDF